MPSDRPSSSIDRRVLISGMVLLPVLSAMPLAGIAQAQTTQGGSLASWNDGPAKQAILDFVKVTTERASPISCRRKRASPPSTRTARFGSNTRSTRKSSTVWIRAGSG